MTKPVIVTRPYAQAASLASAIVATGRQAIIFPLLEILPLHDSTRLKAALDNVASYALVAFVSPNAIDAAFALLPSWPGSVVFGVMGEGSRAALARYGVTASNATIVSPTDLERTDSETLLAALDIAALKGKRVLIIRGVSGRELLADALLAAGVQVSQVAAYRRVAPKLDQAQRDQLRQLIDTENDWIISSSEALRILIAMVAQLAGDAGVAKMQQQQLIVPHVRIAETAQALGFRNITRTGSGDERLLAALQSCS